MSKIIIVKVEYSSRKRSGLGATMVHQLKVERSKPCGQFFLLPRGFLISFKYIALVNSPPDRDFLRFRR